MKVRAWVASYLVAGVAALSLPQWLPAQDSGPGPVPPATEAFYEATLARLFSRFLPATLTFSAGEADQGALTSGPFEGDVNGTIVVGTWHAVDVGDFAIWTVQASGETSTFIAAGFATPTNLIGQALTNAAGGGNLRYLLIGEVAVTEPPPT
jgi:hypothetical protein